jgi:hypothetical protein
MLPLTLHRSPRGQCDVWERLTGTIRVRLLYQSATMTIIFVAYCISKGGKQ